jgi:drug/metabolite transporter (DMT)-like permease
VQALLAVALTLASLSESATAASAPLGASAAAYVVLISALLGGWRTAWTRWIATGAGALFISGLFLIALTSGFRGAPVLSIPAVLVAAVAWLEPRKREAVR